MTQVQMDELWTFVRKKERMLQEWEKLHSEWGDTWVWVACDPVHKLVIAALRQGAPAHLWCLGPATAQRKARSLPQATPNTPRRVLELLFFWDTDSHG